MSTELPSLDLGEIRQVAATLAPHLVRTPVTPLQGHTLNALLDPATRVHLKLELFQRTGTFKARGALNVAMQLTPEALARGVTAVSAGNHAVAAAFAAQAVGASAKVVVQRTANPARLAAARGYGAEIVLADDGTQAFAEMDRIVREEGRTAIHPFEGLHTSLGTATLGLEFIEQVPDMDAVIIAVGGGGLASGAAAAVKEVHPDCAVYGVEPVGAAVMRLSFDQGEAMRLPEPPRSVADSLAPPMTLPMSYGLCRRYLTDVVTVSDDEICRALAVLFRDGKLAVEPAAAAALAALLGPLRETLAGKRVGLVVCGANLDHATYADLLAKGEAMLG